MPKRKTPLVNGQIYHIFSRGIGRTPTFTSKKEYKRAQETINYYRFLCPPIKLSRFLRLSLEDKRPILDGMQNGKRLVSILSYCLMPNHFHLLLRQCSEKGISKFMSNFLNSYTKYFNTRHQRAGALFLGQFKAVRIEDDNQLLHVSRYIHLNPYTSYVVNSVDDLLGYDPSSFPEYVFPEAPSFCDRDLILRFYRRPYLYKKFVLDQKDYQRKLKFIKHLMFE